MSIQDSERAFHVWAASSGAINHRGALGGLYWAQAAWKHQQARIDQLEKELIEARKDAERRLKIIRQVWLDMRNDDGQCGLCGNDGEMISFYAEEHQEWCAARKCKEEMEHAAIDAAMEAK